MDYPALLAALMRERPALEPALRAVIELVKSSPQHHSHANTLIATVLLMQSALDEKRRLAASLLREQPCATTEDGRSSYLCLRHIPDVSIRTICAIAETPHVTNAQPEWLDKMEAKHANG